MASTSSVSGSETELNHSTDNVELPLKENNENSYVNDWVDLTVEEEIARGSKFREEVKRQTPKVHKTYDVINVNSKKSPCSESSGKGSRQRNRATIIKIQTNSCSPCRSRISHTQRTRNYTCSTQSSRSRSRVRRCPLRIAELAVPSKRHCMATWRDNAGTLPILMVQRLKKYVMDESAVVQVSDAITCFQHKRKAPRSCEKKKESKDKPKVCLKTLKNAQDMMNIRNLCAIFGHNLAKKLVLPMNITLNSDWQRVSDVVSQDIADLIKSRTRFYSDDNHFNKGIREEISNKVAVWISTILEDTSYKLLEEDLRDLEEEEGPALEFIDDLVNNVMNVCIISTDTEYYSDGMSDSEQSSHNEPEQITDQSNESKGGTIQEIMNDLINDIIGPEFSDKSTTDEGNNKTKDSKEILNDLINDIIAPEFSDKSTTDEGNNKTKDSKEILNDLINDIIAPEFSDKSTTDEGNNKTKDSKEILNDLINDIISPEFSDKSTTDEGNNKTKDSKEILNDLINDIIAPEFSDKSTTDEENNKTKDISEHVNTEPILDLKSDPITDADGAEIQYDDAEMNNYKLNPVQNSIALEGTRDDINLFNPVLNNQDDNKVSEVFVVLKGEEPLDDKYKKVKFSDLSMAKRGLIQHSIENFTDNYTKSKIIPNLSKVMSFTNKPDILIAPPNEYLLSDADESWPEDITTPMLRLSESVSRSVTSLGRIFESEEKVSNPQDEENMKQEAQIVEGLVEHRVKTIEPDHHTSNITDQRNPDKDAVVAVDSSGDDTRRISMENIGMSDAPVMNFIKAEVSDQATNTADLNADITISKTGGISDDNTDAMEDGNLYDISCTEPLQVIEELKVEINKIKSKQITENETTSRDDRKGEINDTKPIAAITNSKLITGEALLKDVGKGDHNDDVDRENNLISEAVQQIIKLPYVETKFDYRVDPRTAPAWVIGSQPREDSLLDFSKINNTRKLKESEIRKWCKDLEQSFINLEQWNNWVENTCKQIIFYKQRGEVNKVFAPNARKNEGRHWVKLKRTVNRDAVLWTKLSMRTREILEKYRFAHQSTTRLNEEVQEILLKRKHSMEGSILSALDEIDRHCLWMHRLIVSTEYCVQCNCKAFSRNK